MTNGTNIEATEPTSGSNASLKRTFSVTIGYKHFKPNNISEIICDDNMFGSYLQFYKFAPSNQLGYSADYFTSLINFKYKNCYSSFETEFGGSKYNFNSKALIASYNKEIEEQTRLNSGEIGNREEEPSDTTFTLTALGDVLCHNTQYWDAYDKNTDTYDFSYVFDDINKYTKTSDICVASLETSFAGKERRI